jgi:hypothetical protein
MEEKQQMPEPAPQASSDGQKYVWERPLPCHSAPGGSGRYGTYIWWANPTDPTSISHFEMPVYHHTQSSFISPVEMPVNHYTQLVEEERERRVKRLQEWTDERRPWYEWWDKMGVTSHGDLVPYLHQTESE